MRSAPSTFRVPRRSRAVVAVLATVVLLSGCGSAPRDSEVDETYLLRLASLVVEAEESDASDEQLQFLYLLVAEKRAATFEEYVDAVDRTLTCARDAGVGIDGPYPSKSRNQPTLSWGAGGAWTDEEGERLLALHDACQRFHSHYIEVAYMMQPAGMEWEAALFEEFRPAIIECLRNYGLTVADDASAHEINSAVGELIMSEPGNEGPSCNEEVGHGDALREGFQ